MKKNNIDLNSFDKAYVFPNDILYGNHFTSTHPSDFFTFTRVAALLLFLLTDGHFEIHVIDIRSAFAKAMAGQVLDIPVPFRGGVLEASFGRF